MSDVALTQWSPATSGIQRLTGVHASAIAVFRLTGRPAFDVAQRHLQLRRSGCLWEQPLGAIAFGHWRHAAPQQVAADAQGHPEEVVFCRTGIDVAELHTHGSLAVADSLFDAFRRAGLSVVEDPGEPRPDPTRGLGEQPPSLDFLEPAWFPGLSAQPAAWWNRVLESFAAANLPDLTTSTNDPDDGHPPRLPPAGRRPVRGSTPSGAPTDVCRADLERVETSLSALQRLAYRALERSPASEVGRILWNQVRGSLLIELMAIAQICRHDRAAARERLDRLLQTWPYGQFLSREILVLVTGPPNVGKSSLINALIGYQRAVVSPVPGTTRDLVGQSTAFSGWPFRLLDSAGLRTTDDALELQGIDRARRAVGQVDLVIQLRAVDQDPTDWVEPDPLPPHVACLTVLNKVDLLEPSSDLGPDIGSDSGSDIDMGSVSDQRLLADSEPGGCFAGLRVSTVTGHGLSELARAIVVTVLPAESGASQPEGGPDSHLEPTPIGGLVHDEPEAEVEAGVVFAPEIRRWLIQWRECLTNLLQETSP